MYAESGGRGGAGRRGMCLLFRKHRSSLTPEPRKVGSEPVQQALGCSGHEYVLHLKKKKKTVTKELVIFLIQSMTCSI